MPPLLSKPLPLTRISSPFGLRELNLESLIDNPLADLALPFDAAVEAETPDTRNAKDMSVMMSFVRLECVMGEK